MMSTTGRRPVMAAPTPRPVIPASEIGESITRSTPKRSTRPESTLNGVPASATSSPITKTVGSRSISSVIASLTASANVISRVGAAGAAVVASGKDMEIHLRRIGVRRLEAEPDACGDLPVDVVPNRVQLGRIRMLLGAEPGPEPLDRVVALAPVLLLLGRAVVGAIDVADVVAEPAVGRAGEERRALAGAGARDGGKRGRPDGSDVLSVDLRATGFRRPRAWPRSSRQWSPRTSCTPSRGCSHTRTRPAASTGRPCSSTRRARPGPALPRRRTRRRPCRFPSLRAASAAPVAIGVLPPTMAFAPRFPLEKSAMCIDPPLPRQYPLGLAEQLGEHSIHPRPFRDAVPVAAVRARDLVVRAQSGADSHRDTLFPDVQVGEPRHQRAPVEVVDLVLERPDQQHPPVEREPQLRACRAIELAAGHGSAPPDRRVRMRPGRSAFDCSLYHRRREGFAASRSTWCRFLGLRRRRSLPPSG